MFSLDQRLVRDTRAIGRMGLSTLLLMNDRSFPWLILVPEREEVREICELTAPDRSALIEEISSLSGVIRRIYRPDKINVGALGNVISQLHVHVIGRFAGDRAWPGPVWGSGPAEPYAGGEALEVSARIIKELGGRLR
jgi:diadenosine tetraphosphate (Ap4A) HIT family hydrolase